MQRSIARANFMKHSTPAIARKNRKSTTSASRVRRVVCEALEERQLMSLTVTLREADGSSSAVVNQSGQVINLQILATITDPKGLPSQDELQDVAGNIVSTAVDGQAIAGNLAATNSSPFDASGSGPGTLQDLNGDGNIDVGGSDPRNTAGEFFARSDALEPASAGTISGTSLVFVIGTATYTVTNANKGGTTAINFVVVPSSIPQTAAWQENFEPLSNVTGTFQAGAPFTVSDPALVVPPTAVNDSATVVRNTPTSVNVLANDQYVVPFNVSSVKITTPATHGTALPQTNGTVLYTPATGYTGSDSFSYTVQDTDGRLSNVATVSLNIVLPPPPVAGAVSSTTTREVPDTINVLSSDSTTSPATLIATSVTVTTQPAHGTALAQTNGTIIYTPATGYTGPDSFTYTVSDTNGESSSPGTVSITVNSPTPPSASDDTGSTSEGAPVSLDVLANDTTPQGTLSTGSVVVTTAPADGTAVPQADGTILYTPAAGFVGSDSFQYTVDDSLGDVSNAATVSITVAAGVPPVASTVTAPALAGQTSTINVLSGVTSGAPLVPSTVTIATPPANGTAAVNASNGSVSYTPTPGFVGTDSFTYSVANVNTDVSNTATVNVDVGTTISSAKGSAHSLVFTDAAGGKETITLSTGTAELFFSGTNGSVAVSKAGKATVSGSNLAITSIVLTGTSKSSALSFRGSVKTPLTVGGITDSSPLGSISAPSVILSGTTTLNSAGSINVDALSNAVLTIGAGAPGHLSLTTGAVTNSALTSSVPVTSIRAASWTGGGNLDAPSIGSLTIAGAFDPALSLTANGKTPALSSARITGSIDGGSWDIPGSIGTVTAGAAAAAWAPSLGAVKSLTIRSGGLSSALNATAIGSLIITGDVTGNITAASAKLIRVNGNINGSSVALSGALGQLIVTSTIGNAIVSTGGNISSITAGVIGGSAISAGVVSGTTLATAATSNLGGATISSIRLTGKPASEDEFTSSSILAAKITTASLGSVTTNNGGNAFGLAVDNIKSFTGIFSGNELRANKTALANDTVLGLLENQVGVTFGDFEIAIEG